jgi:hypothetical protein
MNNKFHFFVPQFLFFILIFINSCSKELENTGFSKGAKVRITDIAQTYNNIADSDCLSWDNLNIKKQANAYKWRDDGYGYPKYGDEGFIVQISRHCNKNDLVAVVKIPEHHMTVNLQATNGYNVPVKVKVPDQYVPINVKGIERY